MFASPLPGNVSKQSNCQMVVLTVVSVIYGNGVQDSGLCLSGGMLEYARTPLHIALRNGKRNAFVSSIFVELANCYRVMSLM